MIRALHCVSNSALLQKHPLIKGQRKTSCFYKPNQFNLVEKLANENLTHINGNAGKLF